MLPNSRSNQFVNLFPDCVYLDPTLQKSGKERIGIFFTIVFGEHVRRDTVIGEVSFGIKGGELQIEVQNGSIDPNDIEFIKEFVPKTKINAVDETSESQSNLEKQVGQLKGAVGIASSVESSVGVEAEMGEEHSQKKVKNFSRTISYIKGNWHPTKPRWMFYHQLWDAILEGKLDKAKFVTISCHDLPISIDYKFLIKPRDILFTEVYPLSNAKTANKRAILRVLLTKVILKIENTLSEGNITHHG